MSQTGFGCCHFWFDNLREERSCPWLHNQVLHVLKILAAHGLKIAHITIAPWRFHRFPAFSIESLSLVCCSEAVYSALSCTTGVIAFQMHVHLSVLMGGGNFSVLLCHSLLGYSFSSDLENWVLNMKLWNTWDVMWIANQQVSFPVLYTHPAEDSSLLVRDRWCIILSKAAVRTASVSAPHVPSQTRMLDVYLYMQWCFHRKGSPKIGDCGLYWCCWHMCLSSPLERKIVLDCLKSLQGGKSSNTSLPFWMSSELFRGKHYL